MVLDMMDRLVIERLIGWLGKRSVIPTVPGGSGRDGGDGDR